MKFVPVNVSVNAAPPTVADVGAMLVSVGAGLPAGLIVNVCDAEVPPPGVELKTVTLGVPVAAI